MTVTISTPTLESLRQAINQVDNDIISLLQQRMSLAKQVGQLKSSSQQSGLKSYLRPAREAAVIRKALANNRNDYPAEAIYAIWRQIMASCVHNEQSLSLIGYSPEGDDLSTYLAKAYFGDFPKLDHNSSSKNIIETIKKNPTHIAIFPISSKGWWLHLKDAAAHHIYIFAFLPFVSSHEGPTGVAVSTLDLEQTEQDQTWAYISLGTDTPSHNIEKQIQDAEGQLIDHEGSHYLALFPGFKMDPNDTLWMHMQAENSDIHSITPIGCHPIPIRIPQ